MKLTYIGHRSELSNDGDYVCLPTVTAYNHRGDIIVFNGLCPHRGARLFDQGAGNKEMKCPYHAWKADFIEGKVDRYLTAWVGDFLFATDGVLTVEDELEGMYEMLSELSGRVGKRHSYDFLPMKCDWRVAVENTLEDMHVPEVHSETFATLGLSPPQMHQMGKHSVAYYAVNSRVTRVAQNGTYFHLFLYPNTCISSVGGMTYSVQQYFPIGAETVLLTRLYSSVTGRADFIGTDFFLDKARAFNMRVFAEDAAVCARVEGFGTILTGAEQRVKWFRESNND